jgi:hypothetical protein
MQQPGSAEQLTDPKEPILPCRLHMVMEGPFGNAAVADQRAISSLRCHPTCVLQ